jgi:hypothetical protein
VEVGPVAALLALDQAAALLLFIALRLLTGDVVSLRPLVGLAAIAAILFAGLVASVIGDRVVPPDATEFAERRPPQCPPGHASPFEPLTARPGEPEPS